MPTHDPPFDDPYAKVSTLTVGAVKKGRRLLLTDERSGSGAGQAPTACQYDRRLHAHSPPPAFSPSKINTVRSKFNDRHAPACARSRWERALAPPAVLPAAGPRNRGHRRLRRPTQSPARMAKTPELAQQLQCLPARPYELIGYRRLPRAAISLHEADDASVNELSCALIGPGPRLTRVVSGS